MKIPKYQQIQNELQQEITSGKFENGDKFYTETELTQLYKVSSITVIRALNELVKDGYLIRQQGKGTFISRARKGKLLEFSDIEMFPLEEATVTVLSCKKGNDQTILKKLNLDKHDFYYKIKRLRTIGQQPYMYHQTYLPAHYIQNADAPLEHFNSIYQRFKLDFGIHMVEESFKETNEICLTTPEHIATLLHLSPSEPSVLQLKTTTRVGSQEILEYTETHKHWKFFKFEISSHKH
ncbi:GntR family transcriptional regulator [Streptococcus ovis]|uniref:GntR family transcriptional regulator n=1 Tax=Streptococcus ovis TaxID=82806 RepID=UPI000382A205|nr:GntR family transcriptional regulator [Streptococcus ovis]